MTGVNLIPLHAQLTMVCRRRLTAWILAVFAAVAVLCIPLTMNRVQRTKAASLRETHERLQAEVAETRSDLRSLTDQASATELTVQRAEALRAKRDWSALLAMVARSLPNDCWLSAVSTDPSPSAGSARLAGAHAARRPETTADGAIVHIEAPRALKISGYSTDPSQPIHFVTAMKETAVFEEVTLLHIRQESIYGGSYFRFELRCTW